MSAAATTDSGNQLPLLVLLLFIGKKTQNKTNKTPGNPELQTTPRQEEMSYSTIQYFMIFKSFNLYCVAL